MLPFQMRYSQVPTNTLWEIGHSEPFGVAEPRCLRPPEAESDCPHSFQAQILSSKSWKPGHSEAGFFWLAPKPLVQLMVALERLLGICRW